MESEMAGFRSELLNLLGKLPLATRCIPPGLSFLFCKMGAPLTLARFSAERLAQSQSSDLRGFFLTPEREHMGGRSRGTQRAEGARFKPGDAPKFPSA